MGATIRDVAERASVSLGTVSKYINGGSVKEVNREKIARAIIDLQFKPNNIAKGLRNAKTFTIVILVSSLSQVFLIDIINGIEHFLSPLGYSIIVCDCYDDEEIELQKAKQFINRMVDGIVLMTSSDTGATIDYIKKKKVPLVILDKIIEGHACDSVVLNNEMAVYLPTKNLLEKGHKKIGLICGDENHFSTKGRIKGYKKAYKEHNIEICKEYIISGDYTIKGGSDAFHKMWQLEDRPTSVIASNYDMTLGLFIAINNLKLKIPEDISVIGFDVLSLAEVISPPLSLVGQPLSEIGKSVGKLLFKRVQGNYENYPEMIIHEPFMQLRESDKKV